MDSLREPPKTFGHQGAYRVIAEIGRGGSATVYKARQEALDRLVAIKVMRPEVVGDEGGLERFKREARAAARLGGHPNIVGIYDYDEQNGTAYLVLEYIEGTTLQHALASQLPASEAERIVSAVASALDYAHARQLIHRDVKPANVLIGADGRVVLSDFGIAKMLDTATSLTAATIGTPEYMSPEQIVGSPVDARSDIYSLGVMVYRIFAGNPPFQGGVMTLLHKHVNEPPPPMAAGKWPVPPGVEQVVQRAMAKDPNDRYATAGELAADLARALGADGAGDSARTAMQAPLTDIRTTAMQRPAPVTPPPVEQPTRMSGSIRTPTPPLPAPVRTQPPAQIDSGQAASSRRLIWGLVAALGLATLVIAVLVLPGLFQTAAPSPTPAPTAAAAATSAPPAGGPPTSGPATTVPSTAPPASTAPAAASAAAHTASHGAAPTAAPAAASPASVAAQSPGALSLPNVVSALIVARNLHTATLLPNGKVLVVGGRDGRTGLASAELYDRTTNAWSPAGTLATPRFRHSAVLLSGGRVLVVGGQESDTGFLATAEVYDPETNEWRVVQPMSVARASQGAVVLGNGEVLVVGGYNGGTFHNTAEIYIAEEDRWRPAAQMSAVRIDPSATRLADGTVLVAGGFGSASQATAERYDRETDQWSPAGSMLEGRVKHSASLLPNGKLLVVGGDNSTEGGTYLATAELYDPAANSWSAAAPTAAPRSGHVAVPLDGGRILVAGGRNKETSVASAEVYDPGANTWSATANMAVARWLPVAAPLPGGRVLIAGGRVGNSSLITTEEFDPATNAWQSQPQVLKMELTSQNNSNITGTATLTEIGGGKLRVEIRANGAGAGPQPAHIHEGSCTNLNPAPKGALTFVTDGVSVTELDLSIQDLTSAPHAIHMHKSPDELPIYVACADTRQPS